MYIQYTHKPENNRKVMYNINLHCCVLFLFLVRSCNDHQSTSIIYFPLKTCITFQNLNYVLDNYAGFSVSVVVEIKEFWLYEEIESLIIIY